MEGFLGWLWQGSALVVLVSGLLRLVPFTASTRYVIWWSSLLGLLVMPWLGGSGLTPSGLPPTSVPDTPGLTGALAIPQVPDWLLAMGVGVWLVVCLVRLGRICRALLRLRWLKRTCQPFPPDRVLRLPRWRAIRSTSRPVRLCQSTGGQVASVLGYLDPVILVPTRLAATLTDAELDHVLLHEHAHVRRWDDWAKLLQAVIEALVCFHPGVWFAGRALDLEREVACDDWVIAQGSSTQAYASCLAKVAATITRPVGSFLVPGMLRLGSSLFQRVSRLLDGRRPVNPRASLAGAVTGIGMLAGMLFLLGQVDPVIVVVRNDVAPAVPAPRAVGLLTLQMTRPAVADDAVRVQGSGTSKMSVDSPKPSGVRVGAGARTPLLPPVASGQSPADSARAAPDETLASEDWFRFSTGQGGPPSPVLAPVDPAPLLATVPIAVAPDQDGLFDLVDAQRGALTLVRRETEPGPWTKTATVGVKIGEGTKRAGLAAAGFFKRLGVSVARAF